MITACTRCQLPCAEPGARFCPNCGGLLAPRDGPASSEDPATGVTPALPPADSRVAERLAGARCPVHPEVPARDVCSRCGAFACLACLHTDPEGHVLCTACAARTQLGTWDIPWEKRASLGWFKAYWETAKTAAFAPQKAFVGMSPEGQWWDAMSYGMASYALGLAGTLILYGLIFGGVGAVAAFSGAHVGKNEVGVIVGVVAACLVGIAVLIPVGAIMRIYLGAGIDHLALKILGGGKAGFDATFRGYCYSMSPAMFGLIPGCGIYIWEIWRLVISVIAYKSVHGMTAGRAAAAVLIPIGLCCGLYFGLVVGTQVLAAMFGHA